MNVLVAGFPYVRERYFATFRLWPEQGGIRFLLPRRWTAKGGAVVFDPPRDANVSVTDAYFHHSDFPIIGGLLKGWMPGFVPHLWKLRNQVDIVYSCSEPTLLTTLFQAFWTKMLGKKHVCFTWENIPYREKFSPLSYAVHRVVLWANLLLSDGLICGNREGEVIHRAYTSKPIAVIAMNGLDPDVFVRRQDPFSRLTGRTVYAYVGAIGYRKGIHVAIQALRTVLVRIPDAHLIIAGAGEYEKQISKLIDEAGVRDHVTRLPWADQKELIRLLSETDVFLYPSIPHKGWAEQFGYSMAEASLMEIPVISTRSGSISDIIIDGQTGILVPPGDVDALAAAMLRLGTDPELRASMGVAGRRYISGYFSHSAVALHYYDFLSSI
jgi:glycosyltransferase involved in cell wall biosynthesis